MDAMGITPNEGKMGLRQKIDAWITSAPIQKFITGVILVNAVLLGLDTSEAIMSRFGGFVSFFDTVCLVIFITEISLKLFSQDIRFFKSGWNLFDSVVIGVAILPGLSPRCRAWARSFC